MSDEEDMKDLLPDKPPNIQNVILHRQAKTRLKTTFLQYFHTAILSSLVGLLFGYEDGLGVVSLVKLRSTINLDCSEENAVVTSWIIGALFSSFVGGSLVDKFGAKAVLSFCSSLLFSCSLMSSLTESFLIFLSSRILAGFSGSLLIIAQYINITQTINNKKYQLMLLMPLFAFISYMIRILISLSHFTWRTDFGLSSVLSFITFITLMLSPRTNDNFKDLQQAFDHGSSIYCSKTIQTFILGITLTVLCEVMGHSTIAFYSPIILGMFGVCAEYQQSMSIIILIHIRVITTVILISTIDKIGRRTSLILGTLIMAVALPLLGILSLNDIYDNSINIQELQENTWTQENTIRDCHRIVIGLDMSYVTEPHFISNKMRKLPNKSSIEEKTPYPFLPTPLAMTAKTETANSIDFLFDCNHNNSPWSDDSLFSKATKLILIFIYESGKALASNFIYWIVISEIAPWFIRGRLMGVMYGIHWLSALVLESTFAKFIDAFTISGVLFLHFIACLIALVISFLFVPEDDASLNDKKFYLHSMLNNLRFIPGFRKSRIADIEPQSTAI